MYRATLSLALILVVVALVAAQWSAAPVATADSQYSRDIAVLLVDGDAMRHAEGGVDLASSFVGLLSALQDDRLFVFMSVDAVSQTVGPYRASDPEYPNIQDEIEARMKSPSLGHDGDLAGALLEARETLSRERASAGSEVYLITGDSTVKDFARLALQISPLVDRFSELGWRLNGVTLPGASPDIVGFLDRISSESGGRVFELSDSDGLRSAADAILAQDVRGSLSEIGSRVLVSAELMSSVVSIEPGTSEFTLMLFRENPEGSLHLSNPSGFDVSPFDRAKTQVIETPNAVIWKLKDPAPGNWRLDSRGMRGLVSAWEYSNNNYILVLVPTAPVPLGQPISLVAYVQEGDRAVALEGVRLFANITTPAGTRVVIEMKDDGTGNDGTAGDGNYTMMLPPLGAEGGYKVELELVWLEYNHRISTFTGFEARVYPRLSVDTYDVENIEPGERVQVATVLVHVEGEPYPVAPEQMIAILNTSVGSEGEVEGGTQEGVRRRACIRVRRVPHGAGPRPLLAGLQVEHGVRRKAFHRHYRFHGLQLRAAPETGAGGATAGGPARTRNRASTSPGAHTRAGIRRAAFGIPLDGLMDSDSVAGRRGGRCGLHADTDPAVWLYLRR